MDKAGPREADNIFLATTAIEEFWSTDKPIVFLGEWCRLHGRRSFWTQLDGQVLRSPYENPKAIEHAYKYVKRIYEHLLLLLGTSLNSIHGKNHSDRYWRILLGPWLQLYLPVIYDRYTHIKYALDRYPNFTTIGLSGKSFVVPIDTLEFACHLSDDLFNLQLYTKILTALGVDVPCKDAHIEQKLLYERFVGNSWKRRVVSYPERIYANISSKLFPAILLRNSYFSKEDELRLMANNIGRVLPCRGQVSHLPVFNSDASFKRDKLKAIDLGGGEFEKCLSAMLFSDMPQCFVEGAEFISDQAEKNYPKKTKAIFSANAWYYDEVFKRWAATSADAGTLLLGTQHGGNYGSLASMPSEDHEVAIVDRYYSWGWTRRDCPEKFSPMPATKLMSGSRIGADNKKTGILWVATVASRYVTQYPFLPMYFNEYLAWQARFVSALPKAVAIEVRFRPHSQDYGWGIVARIKESMPDIQIEQWDIPFIKSLDNCRLYVCDHLSTTFVEALSADKPTILFWDCNANKLRVDAQPYYDLLREAGILFDTPEAAALAVNDVYSDVEAWWKDSTRQMKIRQFCDRFARTAPDALNVWSREFSEISSSFALH